MASVLVIPWDVSIAAAMLSSEIGDQKLGHPVPESNFVSELNSTLPQQTQL
jgi:hypothetical protein